MRRFAYLPSRWEKLADGAILPNIRQRPWLSLQAPFLLLAYLVAALYHAWRWRPSALHAHWIVPGGLVAAVVKILTGRPFVVTAHGADVFALRQRPLQLLKHLICQQASTVGATSQELARALPVTSTPIEVIPMGVDVEELRSTMPARNPEYGRFLFVGRLADKKGVDVLIRAAALVEGARVVIGGDGPERPSLEELAATEGLEDRVTFCGRLPRSRVIGELCRAQAVVIPSRPAPDGDRDTTPLVMSEAMSVGCPVIASRLGGLAEQIEDGATGILVEPGSVENLADSIRTALANPADLESMGWEGSRRIKTSPLDLATTARRYMAIFEQLATSETGRTSTPHDSPGQIG